LKPTVTLRPIAAADSVAVSELILGLAAVFLNGADPADAGDFLATLAPAALRDFFTDPAIDAWVALDGDDIVGVASMKDHRHLYHLFVQPQQQGRGIARQLWTQLRTRALAHGWGGIFTVNASLNAVPVYRRLGFAATAAPQTRHGVRYQPMQLTELQK
jgi:GNAT superfamily N-acetyltransferase